MGKTKEMLIGMQEEMAMNFPTPSSNTLSDPVQTPDIEALTRELYNIVLDFVAADRIKYQFCLEKTMNEIRQTLKEHGIT